MLYGSMNDEERTALAEKLDADLQLFIDDKLENAKQRPPKSNESEKSLDELVEVCDC